VRRPKPSLAATKPDGSRKSVHEEIKQRPKNRDRRRKSDRENLAAEKESGPAVHSLHETKTICSTGEPAGRVSREETVTKTKIRRDETRTAGNELQWTGDTSKNKTRRKLLQRADQGKSNEEQGQHTIALEPEMRRPEC
jgi:hypothetical protein